jgi:hypothetical protein
MPALKKTLEDFVRGRTFLTRRHRALLASSPPLADPALRPFQERHCNEQDSLAQLQIARELERALRERPQVGPTELAALLRPLGKPGSVEQVLKFFPRFFTHRAGPMAGKPFVLEPFQERFLRQFFLPARDPEGERKDAARGRARPLHARGLRPGRLARAGQDRPALRERLPRAYCKEPDGCGALCPASSGETTSKPCEAGLTGEALLREVMQERLRVPAL